ncbi:hypothetical protein BUALT_Bualt04G0077000 [Buddleja alternifolia]|uniref:Protein phosphatase n=1 Tax=Buddleja alternifolia TaxID=168488 RepID=A0AAV6XP52_9LAMI|nr:hypothetical protein BUALT_Bualt04G0077000 [Buddleja alternifolia]
MPSGLLSHLNTAFSFGFPRAVRVNQSQPLHLIDSLLPRKLFGLRYSSYRSNIKTMAASGSMVASGDLVVDSLLSSCGNLSGFVKPGGVFYNDRSYKICQKARVSMRSGSHHCVQGFLICDFELRSNNYGKNCRTFSSSCYSDGIAPGVSSGSLSGEHLSSLAVSPEQRTDILKLVSGACYMPHPAKEKTGHYARELMSNSVKAIRELQNGDIDPLGVLVKAHAETKAMGSSTAVIIALKNQDLHAINLGDSGFIIIREGSLIFESPVQQHGFNFTYQLATGTDGDQPSSGQVFKISVLPGDVVVAGSDGLFDNLYNKEVAAIVGDAVKDGLGPDATAQKIAAFARVRALDRKHRTPFSTAAQEAGFTYYGGKLDDLTVVVSYVSTSPNA